jgi:mRNA-degrading endonuclease RelE of RelBE toxin-antitoxin system
VILTNIFTIRIKDPAEEWLKKYDKNIQQRFANKIRKLQENPELHGKPLRTPLHGYWELYFEKKFRIYYTIDNINHIVYIEAIKHKDEC